MRLEWGLSTLSSANSISCSCNGVNSGLGWSGTRVWESVIQIYLSGALAASVPGFRPARGALQDSV